MMKLVSARWIFILLARFGLNLFLISHIQLKVQAESQDEIFEILSHPIPPETFWIELTRYCYESPGRLGVSVEECNIAIL